MFIFYKKKSIIIVTIVVPVIIIVVALGQKLEKISEYISIKKKPSKQYANKMFNIKNGFYY